jgi:hypothetical protein
MAYKPCGQIVRKLKGKHTHTEYGDPITLHFPVYEGKWSQENGKTISRTENIRSTSRVLAAQKNSFINDGKFVDQLSEHGYSR